jgi:hypothetical protein
MGSKRISSFLCLSFLFSKPGCEYVTPTHVLSQDRPVLSVIRHHDPRLGSLGKDLFPQLTGSSSLDGVEVRVDPACVKTICVWVVREGERLICDRLDVSFPNSSLGLRVSASQPDLARTTHSSAPSIVTSNLTCWSTSPKLSPAWMINSLLWKPVQS